MHKRIGWFQKDKKEAKEAKEANILLKVSERKLSFFVQPFQSDMNRAKQTQQFPKLIDERKFREAKTTNTLSTTFREKGTFSSGAEKFRKQSSSKSESVLNYQKIESNTLKELALQTLKTLGRILNILHVYRDGLKYSLEQTYLIVETESNSLTITKQVKQKIRQTMSLKGKPLYLFHLNRQPISVTSEIHSSEYSIFVDVSPKLEIPIGLYSELSHHIKVLEDSIKEIEKEFSNNMVKKQYVYIDQLADRLIEDPFKQLEIETVHHKIHSQRSKQYSSIIKWYENNGAPQLTKQTKRALTPVFDQHSNKRILRQTRTKLQSFEFIKNPHQFKKSRDEIKYSSLEFGKQQHKSLRKQKIKYNKKLKKQNKGESPLLSSQNIPYLVEKYNSTRLDIYNIYSLYQALAQISSKRVRRQSGEKEIDRRTFNEGLEGIGMNVGEYIVSAVCGQEQFISWPEFLKIMSISSSKTPEQKLDYILTQLCQDMNSEYLSRLQIDIMVGSCINKLLQKPDQNTLDEMKQHLLDTIFKQLDPNNQGRISIPILKQRVLQKQKSNDLISFMFLYSV